MGFVQRQQKKDSRGVVYSRRAPGRRAAASHSFSTVVSRLSFSFCARAFFASGHRKAYPSFSCDYRITIYYVGILLSYFFIHGIGKQKCSTAPPSEQNETYIVFQSNASSLVRQILFKAVLFYAFGRIKPAEIIIHCKCAEDVRRPTGSQLKHSLWLIQIKSHA